jgi:hypothetical protein
MMIAEIDMMTVVIDLMSVAETTTEIVSASMIDARKEERIIVEVFPVSILLLEDRD